MPRLGELLRGLRQKRGLSQNRLAGRAQVTTRAVRYWEADQQIPRAVELENVLTALDMDGAERAEVYALLPDRRTIHQVRGVKAAGSVSPALLGTPPGTGDLLRCLRLRRGWTQERLADAMQVNRFTIVRWEATRTLPSAEDVERLCGLLCAAPEEKAVLHAGRLTPSDWSPQLTLEECHRQFDLLMKMRGGEFTLMATADLRALALKRHLRFLLARAPEALPLLAQVEVQHAWWLFMQGRTAEAAALNWRALNMARGGMAPSDFCIMALNVLAAQVGNGGTNPENSLKLLYPWLRLLPPVYHMFLLCDLAFYAGQAQRREEAASLLERGRQAITKTSPEYAHTHYRLTKARVLLSAGKAVEALDWLPNETSPGDGRIHELLVWAETYLAAGEKNAAARQISEAETLLAHAALPARRNKLELLAQQL